MTSWDIPFMFQSGPFPFLVLQMHKIYTYEGEGGYLKPMAFPSYAILSGQSYSFLLFTNQKPSSYWIGGRPLYDSIGVAPGTEEMIRAPVNLRLWDGEIALLTVVRGQWDRLREPLPKNLYVLHQRSAFVRRACACISVFLRQLPHPASSC